VDPQIFISYSSKDQKVARTICTALENRGLACWISFRDVKPGQNHQEQIVKAIRAAKIMVLVFTANANNSNEIKKELALASQNNSVVIPVRIEDVTPNEAFAYEFATRQWIDLFDDWENSIARLVELIAAGIDDQPAGDRAKAGPGFAAATAPASFTRRPGTRWAMLSAVAVAVILAAAIAYVVATLPRQSAPVVVAVSNASPPPPSQTQPPGPAAVIAPRPPAAQPPLLANNLPAASPPPAQVALPDPKLLTAQPSQQPPVQATALGSSPPLTAPPTQTLDQEMVFWESITNSKDAADFQEYLKQYPTGRFAGLAKNRLAALRPPKPAPVATLAPAAVPASAGNASGIHVTSATLGANCGARHGNVTSKLADICDGRANCETPGHAVNYPDPAYGCAKDFAAEWQCGAQSQIFSNSVPAAVMESNVLKLSCP
jgi:hypothetical protein